MPASLCTKNLKITLMLVYVHCRMSNCDEVSSNGGIDGHHSYRNMVQIGNAFDLVNNSGIVTDTIQTNPEAIPHFGFNKSRGFEDLVFGSSVRGISALSNARRSGQFKEEVFLNTLRSFILEKGGLLGEGWHVEFIQSPYGYGPNPFALYCAPDGKKFESMYDVAHYLGISPSIAPVQIDERSDGFGSARRLLAPSKSKRKKEQARAAGKFTESHENARINCREEPCSDAKFIPSSYEGKSAPRDAKSYMEENGFRESQNLSVSTYV